jgi:hypothetical protein
MHNDHLIDCRVLCRKHAARFLAAATLAIFSLSAATAASTPDKSKETPGKAAYQAQHGGFKRDRKITRHILRHKRVDHANVRHAR